MINCDKTKDLMSDYIENEIEPAMKDEVNNHLSICPPCKDLYERTKMVINSLSVMTQYSVGKDFDQKLEGQLARLRKNEKNSNKNSFIKGAFIGAAAAGLVFFSFNGYETNATTPVKFSSSSMNTARPNIDVIDSVRVDSLQNSIQVKQQVDKNLQMVNKRN